MWQEIERALGLFEKVVNLVGPVLAVVLILGVLYVYFRFFHQNLKNGGVLIFKDSKGCPKSTDNGDSKTSVVSGGNGTSKALEEEFTNALYKAHLEVCKEKFDAINLRLDKGENEFKEQREMLTETHEDVAVIRALMGNPRPPKQSKRGG